MAVQITLVRHGETEANAGGVWQGTSDSPLTATGRAQVDALGSRFRRRRFDAIVTSDLPRAVATASAVGRPDLDPRWRELALGTWEGLTSAEIAGRDPAAFAALGSDADVAFGGGERMSDLRDRVTDAFFDLASRLPDGGSALVVSHGGALLTLLGTLLGVDVAGRVLRLTNTAVTVVTVDGETVRLDVYNDATHVAGNRVRAEPGSTHIVLARHGETVANIEGRWQGQTPGELTGEGRAQALRLAAHFPAVEALFTSPLARARETALLVADGSGISVEEIHELRELGFGRWEMLTSDEIRALDPESITALEAGTDIVRGGTGETFAELEDRMTRAVEELAGRHAGRTIGVVSHGAATRAYVMRLLGVAFARRGRIALLRNTAMARVVIGSRGPALAAWNIAPHLEP